MSTVSQVPKQQGLAMDEDGNYILPADHRLPGWTVDALLDEGKVEEAKRELERLVMEGFDSGPGVEATPEFWADLRAEVHGKVLRKR